MKQFKDSQGRWLTTGIFKETAMGETKFLLYTLEEAKKNYLDCDDVTGYEYATKYLGGWKHWLALHRSPALAPHLEDWTEELEVKIRAEAIKRIASLSTGAQGYQASRYLADKGWKVKKAGRTTKDAIKKEARVQSKMYEEFKDNVVAIKKG